MDGFSQGSHWCVKTSLVITWPNLNAISVVWRIRSARSHPLGGGKPDSLIFRRSWINLCKALNYSDWGKLQRPHRTAINIRRVPANAGMPNLVTQFRVDGVPEGWRGWGCWCNCGWGEGGLGDGWATRLTVRPPDTTRQHPIKNTLKESTKSPLI